MARLAETAAPAALGARGDPMLPRPFRVLHTRRETRDTVTLWLEATDGSPVRFAPGQFTMLGVPGYGEVPISISGDPAEPGRLQHTVRDVGDATRALVAARPGSVLLVRGPYGVGWGVEDAQDGDLLVVAGGIGLAPVRPALLAAVAGRRDYRRIVVLIGARSPGELLFTQEVDRWLADTDLDVAVTVDAAPAGWRGRVGLVTSLLPKDLDAARTLALVCGPEIMMRLTSEALLDRGVPAGRIRVSMERNMKCGIGLCGHCQLRELFICVDGPVLAYDRVRSLMTTQEL